MNYGQFGFSLSIVFSMFSRYGRKMASKVKKNGERKLFDLILKEPRLACDVRNTTRDFISFNKLVNCFN